MIKMINSIRKLGHRRRDFKLQTLDSVILVAGDNNEQTSIGMHPALGWYPGEFLNTYIFLLILFAYISSACFVHRIPAYVQLLLSLSSSTTTRPGFLQVGK